MAHADARQVLSLHCAGRRQPTSAIPSAFSSSVGPSDAAAAGAAAAAAGWDISPAQGAPPSRSSMIQKSESLLKMTRMRILTVCALGISNRRMIGGRARMRMSSSHGFRCIPRTKTNELCLCATAALRDACASCDCAVVRTPGMAAYTRRAHRDSSLHAPAPTPPTPHTPPPPRYCGVLKKRL